jgi:copper homeostasis protein
MKYELEVIAFNIESCLIAEENGASRIELCANPSEGGTTPSIGMIAEARKSTLIQLFPIIRPRGGDFLYSDQEFNAMLYDIQTCRNLGCDGVVIGMLTKEGNIDVKKCAQLVENAGDMSITFHRAFDRVNDPFLALEQIIELGCKRILTSGLKPTVMEGIEMLKQLVQRAGERITIMPGSGVRANNIIQLAETTGAKAFHSSARKNISSEMNYLNKGMNESLNQVTLDAEEVQTIKKNLDQFFIS